MSSVLNSLKVAAAAVAHGFITRWWLRDKAPISCSGGREIKSHIHIVIRLGCLIVDNLGYYKCVVADIIRGPLIIAGTFELGAMGVQNVVYRYSVFL